MRIDFLAMHAPASKVWPPDAPLSLRALKGTRWQGMFDLEETAERFDDLELDSLLAGGLSQEHLDALMEAGRKAFEARE